MDSAATGSSKASGYARNGTPQWHEHPWLSHETTRSPVVNGGVPVPSPLGMPQQQQQQQQQQQTTPVATVGFAEHQARTDSRAATTDMKPLPQYQPQLNERVSGSLPQLIAQSARLTPAKAAPNAVNAAKMGSGGSATPFVGSKCANPSATPVKPVPPVKPHAPKQKSTDKSIASSGSKSASSTKKKRSTTGRIGRPPSSTAAAVPLSRRRPRPAPPPPPLEELKGPEHFIASSLPLEFPPELAFRALSCYAFLRTFGVQLRLSPSTPLAFLRALAFPAPNRLLGAIHVAMLRVLYAHSAIGSYQPRGDLPPKRSRFTATSITSGRSGENLAYLDGLTWPLFYDDYATLMEESYRESLNDDEMHYDGRSFVFSAPTSSAANTSKGLAQDGLQPGEPQQEPETIDLRESKALEKPPSPMLTEDSTTSPESDMAPNGAGSRIRFRFGRTLPLRTAPRSASQKKPSIPGSGKKRGRPPRLLPRPAVTSKKVCKGSRATRKQSEDTDEWGSQSSSTETEDEEDEEEEEVQDETEPAQLDDDDEEYVDDKLPVKRKSRLDKSKHAAKPMLDRRAGDGSSIVGGWRKRPRGASLGRSSKERVSTVGSRVFDVEVAPATPTPSMTETPAQLVRNDRRIPMKRKDMTGSVTTQPHRYIRALASSKSKLDTTDRSKQKVHRSDPLPGTEGQNAPSVDTSSKKPRLTLEKKSRSSGSIEEPIRQLEAKGASVESTGEKEPQSSGSTEDPVRRLETKGASVESGPGDLQGKKTVEGALSPIKIMGDLSTAPNRAAGPTANNGKVGAKHGTETTPANGGDRTCPRSTLSDAQLSNDPSGCDGHTKEKITPIDAGRPFALSLTTTKNPDNEKSQVEKREAGKQAMTLPEVTSSQEQSTKSTVAGNEGGWGVDAAAFSYTPVVNALTCSSALKNTGVADSTAEDRKLASCVQPPLVASALATSLATSSPTTLDAATLPKATPAVTSSAVDPVTSSAKVPESCALSSRIKSDIKVEPTGSGKVDTVAQVASGKATTCAKFEKARQEDNLPHLKPLKKLRSGTSYHELSVEGKLSILEYLVDELLTVDKFANELSRRKAAVDSFGASFGELPTSGELEDLVNVDECVVCGLEGDLVCCDGCTGSYHTRCINISCTPPEGKWFCRECRVVDPTKMGHLQGGPKHYLDWFTPREILQVTSGSMPDTASDNVTPEGENGDRAEMGSALSHQPIRSPEGWFLPTPPGAIADGHFASNQEVNRSRFEPNCRWTSAASTGATPALHLNFSEVPPSFQGSRSTIRPPSKEDIDNATKLQDPLNCGSSSGVLPQGSGSEGPSLHGASAGEEQCQRGGIQNAAMDTAKDASRDEVPSSSKVPAVIPANRSEVTDNMELMIVHGFVFCRWRTTKERVKFDSNVGIVREGTSQDTDLTIGRASRNSAPLPLTPSELFHLMKFLGPRFGVHWPLSQIPCDRQRLFVDNSTVSNVGHGHNPTGTNFLHQARGSLLLSNAQRAYSRYFEEAESYNPFEYSNHYALAPVTVTSAVFSSGYTKLSASAHEMDSLFPPRTMSLECLTRDVQTSDKHVVQIIKEPQSVLSPTETLREGLLKMEKMLSRAHLLDEMWLPAGGGKNSWWISKVIACRSVRGFAKLLISLTDSIHTRAFHDGWNLLPGNLPVGKVGKAASGKDGTQEKGQGPIPAEIDTTVGWDDRREVRLRTWELCSTSDILRLVNKESDGLRMFLLELGSFDVSLKVSSRRKRKAEGARGPRKHHVVSWGSSERSVPLNLPKLPAVQQSNSTIANTNLLAASQHSEAPQNDVTANKGADMGTAECEEQRHGTVASNKEKPKKSVTAYVHFMMSQHKALKEDGVGSNASGLSKKVALMWKELAPEERKKWEQIAKEDKERYSAELSALKSNGTAAPPPGGEPTHVSDQAEAESSSLRRSGRCHTRSIAVTSKTPGSGDLNQEPEPPQLSSKSAEDLRNSEERRIKLEKVQKVLKQHFDKEAHWPIAGRRLFVPEGCLARSTMRRLGRNAGAKIVPMLTYSNSYEVGRPAVYHVWRKRTVECSTIEGLVLQLKFLDSFFNKPAINSCESIIRKLSGNKSSHQKLILCSHRDLSNGLVEHFVIHPGTKRGMWLPEESVELSTILVERVRRAKERALHSAKTPKNEGHVFNARKCKRDKSGKVDVVGLFGRKKVVPITGPRSVQQSSPLVTLSEEANRSCPKINDTAQLRDGVRRTCELPTGGANRSALCAVNRITPSNRLGHEASLTQTTKPGPPQVGAFGPQLSTEPALNGSKRTEASDVGNLCTKAMPAAILSPSVCAVDKTSCVDGQRRAQAEPIHPRDSNSTLVSPKKGRAGAQTKRRETAEEKKVGQGIATVLVRHQMATKQIKTRDSSQTLDELAALRQKHFVELRSLNEKMRSIGGALQTDELLLEKLLHAEGISQAESLTENDVEWKPSVSDQKSRALCTAAERGKSVPHLHQSGVSADIAAIAFTRPTELGQEARPNPAEFRKEVSITSSNGSRDVPSSLPTDGSKSFPPASAFGMLPSSIGNMGGTPGEPTFPTQPANGYAQHSHHSETSILVGSCEEGQIPQDGGVKSQSAASQVAAPSADPFQDVVSDGVDHFHDTVGASDQSGGSLVPAHDGLQKTQTPAVFDSLGQTGGNNGYIGVLHDEHNPNQFASGPALQHTQTQRQFPQGMGTHALRGLVQATYGANDSLDHRCQSAFQSHNPAAALHVHNPAAGQTPDMYAHNYGGIRHNEYGNQPSAFQRPQLINPQASVSNNDFSGGYNMLQYQMTGTAPNFTITHHQATSQPLFRPELEGMDLEPRPIEEMLMDRHMDQNQMGVPGRFNSAQGHFHGVPMFNNAVDHVGGNLPFASFQPSFDRQQREADVLAGNGAHLYWNQFAMNEFGQQQQMQQQHQQQHQPMPQNFMNPYGDQL